VKRAVVISLVLVLSLMTAISSAIAVEVTVFGPHQYVRTSGSPDVYSDTFSAMPGQGMLIVRNGSWNGGHRVEDGISSARVTVNGEEIFSPNDFNGHVYYLEAAVNLLEDNSISAELRSTPGSYLTIEVTEDVDPPTATISAGPESIMVGQSAILSWTSTNADSCVIEPGIGSVDVNGSITVSPTETATYTITATGLAGTATDTVTVMVLYPPTVSISADPETIEVGQSAT
jgi:hypothetical protein